MTWSSPEVIAHVDELVAKLDESEQHERYAALATSSYATILTVWDRFKSLVDGLDSALAHPVNGSSASVLRGAESLVGHDAHRLAFWLVHVSRALERAPLHT